MWATSHIISSLFRRRRVLVPIGIICFFGVIAVMPPASHEPPSSFGAPSYLTQKAVGHQSNRPSCNIPQLEPNSSWIPKDAKPVDCSSNGDNVVSTSPDGSKIFVNVSSSPFYCKFSEVKRIDDFKVNYMPYKPLEPQMQWIDCPSQAFHVECFSLKPKDQRVFSQVIRCLYPKATVPTTTTMPVSSTLPLPLHNGPFSDRLNIFFIGFDSMSRVTWLEQLPKSTNYFVEEMGGIILEGYNIVGDGTTAALLGLLSGFYEEELHESRRGFQGAKQLDDFPFLFRQLSKEGYVTLWDEETPELGTFQYRLLGFEKPPVDYYGRPFKMALNLKIPPNWDCFGSLPSALEMFQLIGKLARLHPDPQRKFALVFNSIYSHTSSGLGLQSVYRLDQHLLNEVKSLNEANLLSNSAFIFFSDHGSRFGQSRATARGKLSERLPFLGIALPKWFREKYPVQLENLKAAVPKLTTPFDLHATLLDLAGIAPESGTPTRGISLFKPIAIDRTCSSAGIAPHWCACSDNSKDLDLDSPLVQRSLEVFKEVVMEQLLKSVKELCAEITPSVVFDARTVSLRKEVLEFVQSSDFHGRVPKFDGMAKSKEQFIQISFITEPGHGQWEITLRHDMSSDKLSLTPKQISRTNIYGAAPSCIQDVFPHLRQFCYCKTNLTTHNF